ncbi:helix-turn-helix domain-containing protein [Agrobacterium deltaense]|uniref:helix-turn-helix domain-containing protein n=1 Tax=Agrobacterium deltaense TaxID=1183412 RepID=UPI001C6EC1E6|nr:helix-turn-helix domain-containing protein [Agrobacterium deltaense]MBW9074940.1 DNA-binding protein [Agrobacterium deltaense]
MQKSEVIVGAQAIAEVLGVTERRVRFMVTRKEIPVFKMGGSIAPRRTTLESWIDALEAAGA